MRWLEVTVTIAAEAAEAVGDKILDLGAPGFWTVESGPARSLICYFPYLGEGDGGEPDEPATALAIFLENLGPWGLAARPAEVTTRVVDEAGWREAWKAFFHPVRIGPRLIVYPPWDPPSEERPGDVGVVIDPGQAFGTGEHPTTRGMLELLEGALETLRHEGPGSGPGPRPGSGSGPGSGPGEDGPELRPRSEGTGLVLDLGVGSGVLAIAAAKLGAQRVLAVDNDPVAVAVARRNVEANGVADRVEVIEGEVKDLLARCGDGDGRTGRQGGGDRAGHEPVARRPHLILANLTTDFIVGVIPALASALTPGGVALVAGVSAGEGAERVLAAACSAGLTETDRRSAGNWTSFAFRRTSHRPRGGSGRPLAVFRTLGCKVNLYDTGQMMEQLRREGWDVLAGEGDPFPGLVDRRIDLWVVNSCAVTARAESKSRQLIRHLRAKYPDTLVALVGCYPEIHRPPGGQSHAGTVNEDHHDRSWDGADLVLGVSDRQRLPQLLRQRGFEVGLDAAPERVPVAAGAGVGAFGGQRTRAVLKIQDGCDQACAYCVIPRARGPSLSRPGGDVLKEATELVGAGFGEIVVAGIHLGAWGRDTGARLRDLLRDLTAIPGLTRVRLSSIEPLEVTDDLIRLMARNSRICRHLHIPLQSGADSVLARMNRHYTAAAYLELVGRIRSAIPLVGLTTDVMVGFPGETDEDFRATQDVVRRARFSRLHVFRFSRRPGTPAADLPGQVPTAVSKSRSVELIALGRRMERAFHESLVGLTLPVLVERRLGETASALAEGSVDGNAVAEGSVDGNTAGRGWLAEGLTDNYARVLVRGDGRRAAPRPGQLMEVRLDGISARGLTGHGLSAPVRPAPS